jgi:hypothetical protein
MGAFTRQFPSVVDSVVTECYVYSSVDFERGQKVRRLKLSRSLWDTGASSSLISKAAVDALGLIPVGKSEISGVNDGVEFKSTYLIHVGLPSGDIVTNVFASEFDGEDYDLIVGMDVIQNGDLAVTNLNDATTFSFRIPSKKVIDFESD